MHIIKQNKNLFLLAISTAVLMGCSPTVSQRGNMLEDYQVEEVSVGESKRSDILRTLGSPTTKSTFDSNVWYYIGQETEKRGIFDPEVVKERIFLVAFDPDGTVEAFQEIDRERMSIPYERKKTPTHGNERTITQELLGNLGKFNPQSNESAATTGSGGI
jgi:outer membrane protein assembly factor BamE (lipoprotein component of BamABCDE complex)